MKYIKSLYNGRINRSSYFVGLVIFFITTMITESLRLSVDSSIISLIGSLLVLFFLIFVYSIYVRRLHDTNLSGWYALITFIPFVNIIFMLYLLLKAGDTKKNEYGKVPNTKDRLFKDLFALKN